MNNSLSLHDRCAGALYGMFIGDALAMPAHWYYDTHALLRDYGVVKEYKTPKHPHPDSILWRSSYSPKNTNGDILHEQKKYWGKKGIHYHQFLKAGENTLNVKLARQLLLCVQQDNGYSADNWLEKFVTYLTDPVSHNDTYAEEYLRHFFTNYANGKEPQKCGRNDEKHIGGFSLMLPLLLYLSKNPEEAIEISLQHLALTHGGQKMQHWGECIAISLLDILHGSSLSGAISSACTAAKVGLSLKELESLTQYKDEVVVGRHFSSACYVDYAVPATLFLALKYCNSPADGIIANTMCGGDNAGRGCVLGALLGAAHGMQAWPQVWIDELLHPPPQIC